MQFAQKNFYKKFLGRQGEVKACEYLEKQGYKILEKNYKTHVGEADIIAKDKDCTVFIEVKTRSNENFGRPCEAVTKEKQQKYLLIAKEYALKHNIFENEMRFDVIEIENGEINHILNAFCC